MPPQFSRFDSTTVYTAQWTKWLAKFAGRPNIKGLEVGCFEGRSSIWFLENILQHETSKLTCIDPSCPPVFAENLRAFRHKLNWIEKPSEFGLRDPSLASDFFHFAYIDGWHAAPEVLSDAVMIFPQLAAGGILIFDDYPWQSTTPEIPQTMPKIAIDAFLKIYEKKYRLIHMDWQVCIEKI